MAPSCWAGSTGAPQVATFGAMVADRGVGSVSSVRGETLVRYHDRPEPDIAKLGLEAMGRLLFAAGAVEVLTGLPGAPTVTSLPALQEVLRGANPRSLHLAAFHPTGTAAAGADEQLCPVDPTRPAARGGRCVGRRRVDPAE